MAVESSNCPSLAGWSFGIQGYHFLWPDFPNCPTTTPPFPAPGLFPVRSPLLGESRLISFPPVTEMFQFTGFAPYTYELDRKSTRLNSSHSQISYAVFCLKKKKKTIYISIYVSTHDADCTSVLLSVLH